MSDINKKIFQAQYGHPKDITKNLKNKNVFIREAAIKNIGATKRHIDKAMSDEDPIVRGRAIQHPNATADQVKGALAQHDYFYR